VYWHAVVHKKPFEIATAWITGRHVFSYKSGICWLGQVVGVGGFDRFDGIKTGRT